MHTATLDSSVAANWAAASTRVLLE